MPPQPLPSPLLQFEIVARSDVGRARAANEDSCGVFEAPDGACLMVVADGMGGHRGGATASRLAVDAIGDAIERSPSRNTDALARAIEAANERVHAESLRDPSLRGMGTTVVAMLAEPSGEAVIAHVGDSRAYRIAAGAGRIERLTDDHSVVAELARRGVLSAEEAELHPRRNEILRSVGVDERVEVDVRALAIEPGDRILLCSDGLCGVISDAEIEALAVREPLDAAVDGLIAAANDAGGPDNVTVQIVVARERPAPVAGLAPAERPSEAPVERLAGASIAATVLLGALAIGLAAFALSLWL